MGEGKRRGRISKRMMRKGKKRMGRISKRILREGKEKVKCGWRCFRVHQKG